MSNRPELDQLKELLRGLLDSHRFDAMQMTILGEDRSQVFVRSKTGLTQDYQFSDEIVLSVPLYGPIVRLRISENSNSAPLVSTELRLLSTWPLVNLFWQDARTPGALGGLNALSDLLQVLRSQSGAVAAILWTIETRNTVQVLKQRASSGVQVTGKDVPVGEGLIGKVLPLDGLKIVEISPSGDILHPEFVQAQRWKWAVTLPMTVDGQLIGAAAMYFRKHPDPAAISTVFSTATALQGICATIVAQATVENYNKMLAERGDRLLAGLTVLGLVHDIKRHVGHLETAADVLAFMLPKSEEELELSLRRLMPSIPAAQRATLPQLLASISEDASYVNKIVAVMNGLSEGSKPTARRTDVAGVFEWLAPLMEDLGVGDKQRVTWETKGKFHVRVASSVIERIVANLVTNSLQWGASDVKVSARIRSPRGSLVDLLPDPSVQMQVWDNGRGMSQPEIDACRAPFFTRRAGGTGLGLFVVDHLVQSNGGVMTVSSTQGIGTTVTVWFPYVGSHS